MRRLLALSHRQPLPIRMSGRRSARRSCSAPTTRSPAFVITGPSTSSTRRWRFRGSTPTATAPTRRKSSSPLAKVNVESLKEFGYFTFVHLSDDDKSLPLKEPVGYSIDYDKTLLTLHFTLPLEKPLDPKVHDVAVDVYDPSFFVAFGFATDAPVKITGTAPGCAAEVEKPDPETEADAKALTEAFFSQLGPNSNFGSQFAQTAIIKCTTQ